jgi:hypothetical protein
MCYSQWCSVISFCLRCESERYQFPYFFPLSGAGSLKSVLFANGLHPSGFQHAHFWFVRNAQLTQKENLALRWKVPYSEWVNFKGREICMKGEVRVQIKFWLLPLYERGMKTLAQGWQDREMICEPQWKGLINQIPLFAFTSKSPLRQGNPGAISINLSEQEKPQYLNMEL